MQWITKPNKWYDKQEEPFRFYMFFGTMLILIGLPSIIFGDVGFIIGMFIFCLIGLYRITYFIINIKLNIIEDVKGLRK